MIAHRLYSLYILKILLYSNKTAAKQQQLLIMELFPRTACGFLHWTDPVPLGLTPASAPTPNPTVSVHWNCSLRSSSVPTTCPLPVTSSEPPCALLRLCIGPLWHRVADIFPMATGSTAARRHNRGTTDTHQWLPTAQRPVRMATSATAG